MRIQTESKHFLKIMRSMIPVLVLVLSVGLASQAQATSVFDTTMTTRLSWARFGSNITAPRGDWDTSATGNAFADFTNIATIGLEFLEATVAAVGKASPTGWAEAFSEVFLTQTVTNATGKDLEVVFNFFSSGIANVAIDDRTTETASARYAVEWFFNGVSQTDGPRGMTFVVPPRLSDGRPFPDITGTGVSHFVGANETVTIGLRAFAAGKAHSGVDPIPEPASILLFGSGLIGLSLWRWRRNTRDRKAA